MGWNLPTVQPHNEFLFLTTLLKWYTGNHLTLTMKYFKCQILFCAAVLNIDTLNEYGILEHLNLGTFTNNISTYVNCIEFTPNFKYL